MPKSPNQKLKLLYLAQMLQQESDEANPLTVAEIILKLEQQDISAERKSIYADIEALQQFGMDIIVQRGQSNSYYLGQRSFELPELKLLVDAVQSAKFITEGKSRSLIKKICGLASRHEGAMMARQVHVAGRAKTFNERTYYSVDAIQTAIAGNKKISFKYFEWAVTNDTPQFFGRRWRHGGQPYVISPWGLLWDDEYYYMIGYDENAGIIKHYRVDKMDKIETTKDARQGREVYEAMDIAEYSKSIFGMFGGKETEVTLRFANRLIGVVADRFGHNIRIKKDGDEYFTVRVKAVVSPQFLSWIMGFGDEAQVLMPEDVAQKVRTTAQSIAALYKG